MINFKKKIYFQRFLYMQRHRDKIVSMCCNILENMQDNYYQEYLLNANFSKELCHKKC